MTVEEYNKAGKESAEYIIKNFSSTKQKTHLQYLEEELEKSCKLLILWAKTKVLENYVGQREKMLTEISNKILEIQNEIYKISYEVEKTLRNN